MAKRNKAKHHADTPGQFFSLPYAVTKSPYFQNCKPLAWKLITTLFLQFNGKNNGDISCTLKLMKEFGWNDKRQLALALSQALQSNLLIETRKGDRNKCSLFAFAWLRIHECLSVSGKHKLDLPATSKAPIKF